MQFILCLIAFPASFSLTLSQSLSVVVTVSILDRVLGEPTWFFFEVKSQICYVASNTSEFILFWLLSFLFVFKYLRLLLVLLLFFAGNIRFVFFLFGSLRINISMHIFDWWDSSYT